MSLARGVAMGVGAYIFGFLLVTLLLILNIGEPILGLFFPRSFDFELFLLLHLVKHQIGLLDGYFLFTQTGIGLYNILLLGILIAAGYLTAKQTNGGIAVGSSIVLGFGTLAMMVGILLALLGGISIRSGVSQFILWEYMKLVFIVGIIYPIVFGGMGGFAARVI